ncbi:ASCH domain-containing protein [Paenibacillus elgii]|uniref:ASCH domain-containing protein n=1 Tax=Paenibacillus elgii TaxID=189691 RepID=UPI000248D911|nr:ASCH domain-containing protein [Paenibacillus elgii]
MKAITIIQPWATLIALGEKKFETRSWSTKYRGPLVIHAGKKVDREACEYEPIKLTLAKHGYTADNLPTGAVLATSVLDQCWSISPNDNGKIYLGFGSMFWIYEDSNEYNFGFFDVGRYAWLLTDIKKLPEPIPAKGQQGLWNWEGEKP